jgi:hypothetical protein
MSTIKKAILNFNKEAVLRRRTIQSAEIGLADLSLEFAVLGYLDIARRLVSLLNKYDPVYYKKSMRLKPLWLAWAETGSWPEGEFCHVNEPIEDLAKQYARGLGYDLLPGEEIKNDSSGLRKILEHIDTMNGLSADATTGYRAMQKSSALVKALDLSLQLLMESEVLENTLPSVQDILGIIGKRLDCNCQVYYLCQSARAWPILKEGALAKVINLDNEEVLQIGKEAEEAFEERFAKLKAQDGRSIVEIIRLISENTQNNEGAKEHAMECGQDFLQPPIRNSAPSSVIVELEQRLEIQLPADYKEFLGLSNGFGRSWGGIIMDPPLHSANDVRWLGTDEDYFTELSLDLLEGNIWAVTRDYPEIGRNWPKVKRAIEIGTEDIDNVWLLPPDTVQRVKDAYLTVLHSEVVDEAVKKSIRNSINDFSGSIESFEGLEWCVLKWASGGCASMTGYSSFKDYLVAKAQGSGEVCSVY